MEISIRTKTLVLIIHMRRQFTCTLAIHSRNRRRSAFACLESIKNQTVLPDEILFIENVIENKHFSQEILNAFFNGKIRCIYKTVQVNSKSVSRNLSLSLATSDIYISIDDDALFVDPSILKRVMHLHSRFRNVASFVGPVYPTGSSAYEIFSSVLYYPELVREQMKRITIYPATFFSIRKNILSKLNLKFNVTSHAEDIDFFWRLTRAGGQLMYNQGLRVYAEFPDNLIRFIQKRYYYALWNADLFVSSHGDVDTVSWLFLNSKIKLLLYPLFFIYHLTKNSYETILSKRVSIGYIVLSFVNEVIVALGFFSSQTGRKIFFKGAIQTIL